MNPQYPIFIPTKGRFDSRLTIKTFNKLKIPYKIVIEKSEYQKYKTIINTEDILVLPFENKGLTATRNWLWDHVERNLKCERFWTFDDNIDGLYRFNKNLKVQVSDGTILKVIEDFTNRYENVVVSGMNYFMFVKRKFKIPPVTLNTRVYSNMLIKTNIPFRNELFFNDDTDLCLRILKSGLCTVLFNAFLIMKTTTMSIKGGMTDYYERTNKRKEFAEELQKAHSDVVKLTWKFNRWHHQVDYSPFKKNKLILKKGMKIPKGVNNYGMKLVEINA